ncbi:MAG: endonuclease V [Desulfuromonadaceae bacterium GWC2_58_13]|nr:MAG: endonuclease V [Desulfuromonadaceae bacterium GWC2_58_13]
MEFAELHGWTLDCREAIALQLALAGQVRVENRLPQPVSTVAGVDVSYEKHGTLFFGAVVVLALPSLEPIDQAHAIARVDFPYIPGLLSFRELPVIIDAFRQLNRIPDAVLVDGQGIAHPRGLGLASHLGLWLGLPTIGCAKSRLCGEHAEPGSRRGDRVPLRIGDKEVGAVLTTRDRVKPMYISPGHLIDTGAAVDLVLSCTRRYRMPEPTRLAHHLTNRLRKASV